MVKPQLLTVERQLIQTNPATLTAIYKITAQNTMLNEAATAVLLMQFRDVELGRIYVSPTAFTQGNTITGNWNGQAVFTCNGQSVRFDGANGSGLICAANPVPGGSPISGIYYAQVTFNCAGHSGTVIGTNFGSTDWKWSIDAPSQPQTPPFNYVNVTSNIITLM